MSKLHQSLSLHVALCYVPSLSDDVMFSYNGLYDMMLPQQSRYNYEHMITSLLHGDCYVLFWTMVGVKTRRVLHARDAGLRVLKVLLPYNMKQGYSKLSQVTKTKTFINLTQAFLKGR